MTAIPNCRPDIHKETMTAISAPYNFVPLSDYVHIPEWSKQVSHDWPFQDGYSGEIHYTLTAESPLLVGGEQQKNNATDRPNTEVKPYRLPDGRYAIPGSSLKGMLRSVVEIIGFGRMRMVDEQRPGLRDISGEHVSASYKDKLDGGKVKTGFLRMKDDGGMEIIPCRMKRLDHRHIESFFNRSNGLVFKKGMSVAKKYEFWKNLCDENQWKNGDIPFSIDGNMAILGGEEKKGYVVLTGQISDKTDDKKDKKGNEIKGKYKDFIFYDETHDEYIPVDTKAWRDFLFIHADEDEKSNRPWNGYWRNIFRQGGKVPVFYVQDKDVLRIGLAYMPKLAGDFTTKDCIGHVSPAHLKEPGQDNGYDFADLLFGAINADEQQDALKGRVSLEMAVADGECEVVTQEDTILSNPKPTYFPNYLQQKVDGSTRKLASQQYSTYMATPHDPNPRVRGFKRYPAREQTGVQQLNGEQLANRKVQVRLKTLPEGIRFKGRIIFHNLKREEFGLLLWTLTWGGDSGLRHSLGMGKSFGFGQVRFDIEFDQSRLMQNTPALAEEAQDTRSIIDQSVAAFKKHMENALEKRGGWRHSPQILALKAMADPKSARSLPQGMQLRHMCLAPKEKKNEFVWAKQNSLVLANYATATKYERREKEKAEFARKQQEELRLQREKQKAEEERRREQEQYERLPESGKRKVDLENALRTLPCPIRKDMYGELTGAINRYLDAAQEWSLEERQEAVKFTREILDKYHAWAQPGIKSNKKKKQREKREKQLQELAKQ